MKNRDEEPKRLRHRTQEEVVSLTLRLNKIAGQINGIKKMVESDAYCTDILNQVASTQKAFNSFARELLESHVKSCVVKDIQNGKNESVKELLSIFQKLMK